MTAVAPPPHQPEEEERTAPNETTMEAFPEELLVMIFGHIEDGETLLEGVALACRRWHRLSRDPRSWAGVRLQCHWWRADDGVALGEAMLPEAQARVLVHAPHLDHLDVTGYWTSYYPAEVRAGGKRLEGLLARCDATVRHARVSLRDKDSLPPPRVWQELSSLLERSVQPQLRVLELRWNGHYDKVFGVGLLRTLGRLAGLWDLRLTLPSGLRYDRDKPEEPLALPALRSLSFECYYSSWAGKTKGMPRPAGQLLADLLDGATLLRHLGLVRVDALPDVAVSAVDARCRGLRELRVGPASLGACLPSLRHFVDLAEMTLWVEGRRWLVDAVGDDAALAALPAGCLPALRSLSVLLLLQETWGGSLLAALSRAAPNMTNLCVDSKATRPEQREADLEEALGALCNLRFLRLDWCSAALLRDKVLALEHLEKLEVREVSCPAHEMDDFCRELRLYHARRPLLEAFVKVEPVQVKVKTEVFRWPEGAAGAGYPRWLR